MTSLIDFCEFLEMRGKYFDKETDKELVFLTNNFSLAAQTIADLYKAR